ncbi:MAG: hypothetical protein ACOX0T_12050 [Pelotomaculum sp.]
MQEANNAAQLQRLQQNEVLSSQQLQNIQQMCNRISQEANIISNVAQQVTSQMASRPMITDQYGTSNRFSDEYWAVWNNGYREACTTLASSSSYSTSQINPTDLSSLSSHWGQGLKPQELSVSSQFLSNQNKQFMPSLSTPYQYSSTGFSSNQYTPSTSVSLDTPNQQQYGISLSTPNQNNTGIYSQSGNMPGAQFMGSSY